MPPYFQLVTLAVKMHCIFKIVWNNIIFHLCICFFYSTTLICRNIKQSIYFNQCAKIMGKSWNHDLATDHEPWPIWTWFYVYLRWLVDTFSNLKSFDMSIIDWLMNNFLFPIGIYFDTWIIYVSSSLNWHNFDSYSLLTVHTKINL